MKNIIITGGCGFLGSHLVEKLIKLKHNITIIDNLSNGKISNKFNVSPNCFYPKPKITSSVLHLSPIKIKFKY